MGPPFEKHPTSAAIIRATAEQMSTTEGQLDAVMGALKGRAKDAADQVDGTLDGHISGPALQAHRDAMNMRGGALVCKAAVGLYADHVEIFDRAVDDINGRWFNAVKHKFYVPNPNDAAAIDAARTALVSALQAEYAPVEQALEDGATNVGTALNSAPWHAAFMLKDYQAATAPALEKARQSGYVALGDSYSAGTGAGHYNTPGGPDGDFRSDLAYPALLAAKFGLRLDHRASNSDTTHDIIRDQLGTLGPDTKYVTLTAGGNNVGFTEAITAAATPFAPDASETEIAHSIDRINGDDFDRDLDALYSQIRDRAPNAKIIVGTYPKLFNGEPAQVIPTGNPYNPTTTDESFVGDISVDEERKLNEAADALAAVIQKKADKYGFEVADAQQEFEGHSADELDHWINGLELRPGTGESTHGLVDYDSFHPNADGYEAYADAFDDHFGR